MSVTKSAVLTLALLAGTAVAAQAQTSNIAALPPSAAPSATAPAYGSYPGPQPGASWGGAGQQTQAVVPSTPSGAYMGGPQPGAGTGVMPPHFDKSASYDQDASQHPYTSNMGPRPH